MEEDYQASEEAMQEGGEGGEEQEEEDIVIVGEDLHTKSQQHTFSTFTFEI